MTLKAKLAMLFAFPVYVSILILIFGLIYVVSIVLFILRIFGFIEALEWLLVKTAQAIKRSEFRSKLHKTDRQILSDKTIVPEK